MKNFRTASRSFPDRAFSLSREISACSAVCEKSAELLARITDAGQAGASGGAPDCTLLVGLRASMAALVETQKAKWAYMFDKIDKELRK